MLKKAIRTVFLVGCLGLPVASATAADYKVGFVDAGKVLEQAAQRDQTVTRLEKEFAPRQEALVAAHKEIRKLEDKLVRDGAIMSESERTGVERDLRTRKRELKRQQDEFREDRTPVRDGRVDSLTR